MQTRFVRMVCVFSIAVLSQVAVAQVPSEPGDWPQWRGPNRDGISTEKGLSKEWPESGPKVLWQVDTVGVGYSSLAIKDGRIYTQGDLDGVEHIIALDAKDGKVMWAVQPKPVADQLNERVQAEMKRMDANEDGQLDEVEALRGLGTNFFKSDQPSGGDPQAAEEVAAARVARLLKQLDENTDGKLTFDEAGALLRGLFVQIDQQDKTADVAALAKQRATALLKQLDQDGDNKVSRDESRRTVLDRGFNRADQRDPDTKKGDQQLTTAEIEAYFARYERGCNGVLSRGELTAYYAKNHPNRDGILGAAELRSNYGGYRNGRGDGPRGTPTVDGSRIYTEGGNGDLTCLDAMSGDTLWHVNLQSDLGGGRPGWGFSESPLIEGDLVIVTPGGKQGAVAALNKMTGKVVWRSRETTQGAHYASAVAANIGGVRQIVQFGRTTAFGADAKTGKLLWEYSAANNGTANCCSPIVDGDQVFVSSAYGTGGGLANIVKNDGKLSASEEYFTKKLACHHGGIVKIGDHMYSNGGGSLTCMEFKTGKIAWQSRSVGKGSLVAADGMLYVLSEGHAVALVEATPAEYRERGKFRIQSHGLPSWAHPVVAGGRLYIRDQQSLAAYDVGEP